MNETAEQQRAYVERVRKQLKRPSPPRDRVKVDGATYELVGDVERCDRDWEEQEARRREENWDVARQVQLQERELRRRQSTLGARLDETTTRLAEKEGGMRARPIASIRRSSSEDDDPCGHRPPSTATREREVEEALTLIEAHVHRLEAILDAEDGLARISPESDAIGRGRPGVVGSQATPRMMRKAERDRIVFDDFQGVRSEVVAREAPYLGTSARTIERARRDEAELRGLSVRLVDGVVLGEAEEARAA